jgi:hypothetical protein
MVEKSTGLTNEIHKRIQQIRIDEGITIGGFINYALYEILNHKNSTNNIVNAIKRDERENEGAGRLNRRRFGNDLPK